MDDGKELEYIIARSGFNPLTDTGRAVKFFWQRQFAKEQEWEKRQEMLGETIILSAAEIKQLKKEWEAEHKEQCEVKTAIKRGVLQALKGLKWID